MTPSTLEALCGSRLRADIVALLFGQGGQWSCYEIAKTLGAPYSTVRDAVMALTRSGLLLRTGNDRRHSRFQANEHRDQAALIVELAVAHLGGPRTAPSGQFDEVIGELVAGHAIDALFTVQEPTQ